MNALAQLAALVAGLLHVMIFGLESVAFRRPSVQRTFGVGRDDLAAVRPWAFNQGFYNLFLAIGTLGGLALLHTDSTVEGRTLVLFACGSMLGAAVVLVSSNRRMVRAAAIQGLPPLVALIAALV